MKRTILSTVVVLVCLGLCLGGLVAKSKNTPVQVTIDRDELIAAGATRDNRHILVKADAIIGQANALIAAGETSAAIQLLQQASLLELPATREGQKVLVDLNLALAGLYTLEPAEGLHKSISYYGLALAQMDIAEDTGLMVDTLNTVAGIQTALGNDVEAALMKEAANNAAIGIAPEPLSQLPVGGLDGPGDDDCSTSVPVTLDHTEIMSLGPPDGDHNWRNFSLTEATQLVTIETLSADIFGDDTNLTVWTGCEGTTPTGFLLFDEDGGPGYLSLLNACMAAGDYWLDVGGWENIVTTGDFTLNITSTPADCEVLGLDEYEPDLFIEEATKIGFRNNGVGQGNQYGRDNSQIQTHTIFPGGDQDTLKFSLSRANFVRIETMTDGDSFIGLFKPDGTLIATNDDGGEGLASKLEFCLPAENDWLAAAVGYLISDTFVYDIAVDVEYPCLFEDEPNGSCELAGEIMPGELWSGFQTPDFELFVVDDDWFSFTLEEEGLVTIETDGYDSFAVDTYLELWSGCPDGTLLAADDDGGAGFLSRISRVLPAGTYHVNVTVSPFSAGAEYPYTMSLTVSEPPLAESEPNNDCATANAAAFGDTYLASISPVGDRDNFLLTVPADGYVEVETSGPSGDTVLQIQSADGSVVVACDDDGGSGLFSLFSCCLAAGDYCVTVKDYGNNSIISSYETSFTSLGACTPSGICETSSSSQCNPF